ncbi:hypothetical protein T492DRAFT_872789 [Pavlovales sp. CCMP2436]|nr:hypothetical protein T492DRAFT_872789 [Pavlovales sp. CCMP2436]
MVAARRSAPSAVAVAAVAAGPVAEQLPELAPGRPVKVRDYMYSRKGAPPIMVKAHQRGLPNSKPAAASPTGALITGREWADLFVWTPDAVKCWRIRRNALAFGHLCNYYANFFGSSEC